MEDFKELLEDYLDDEIINEKKELEDHDYFEEEKSESKKSDISSLSGYAITISQFVNNYLKEEPIENLNNLTHKQFKELTKNNPLVVGIFNGDVDIDEVLKQDYIIVVDCFGNLGTYLNPEKLRDFTRLEIIEKQFEKVKEMRKLWCKHVVEYYDKYCEAYQEYMYLVHKCEVFEETLYRVNKKGKVRELKRFVDKHGTDAIGIKEEQK